MAGRFRCHAHSYIKCSDIVWGGWGGVREGAVMETKPDSKVRGDFYKHGKSIKKTTRKRWGDKWGRTIKTEACWRRVFTVGYVGGDADALQQSLRLPPLPLQVRVFVAGRRPTARLGSTLWVSLQRRGQAKTTAAAWRVLSAIREIRGVEVIVSTTYILLFLLLFFSLLLLSNLGDPLFLPLQFSLQLTLVRHDCRRERRCHRTTKRLFRNYFSPCSCWIFMSYLIHSFIWVTHNKLPQPGCLTKGFNANTRFKGGLVRLQLTNIFIIN